MKLSKLALLPLAFAACSSLASAQSLGNITGSFKVDAQSYKNDTEIGATKPDETVLSNSYLNLNYSNGPFLMGVRYESYANPLKGFDQEYKGSGIPYRFLTYQGEDIEATVGNFYEQFGSGMILRSYEDKSLGIDNCFDGVRVKGTPIAGISLTGLVGKQRKYWTTGDGIVRAADANISFNELTPNALPENMLFTLAGSIVSKYQASTDPTMNLPLNVFAYSTRFSLGYNNFTLDGEFVRKNNDPNASNGNSYNPGTGALLTANYSTKGFGTSISVHRIDNMDFRSDRTANLNNLTLNYIPPQSKQYIYRLATLYTCITQPNGEAGVQADFTFTLPKGSALGGEYGTTFILGGSRIQAIRKDSTDTLRYDSPFFKTSNRIMYQDVSLEMQKSWSKTFKSNLCLIGNYYDRDIMEESWVPTYGVVKSLVAVADMSFKLNATNAIKLDIEHIWSTQDSAGKSDDYKNGNWIYGMVEYTYAPNWYFSLWDEYNYGNDTEKNRIHYVSGLITYVHNTIRISGGFGRQRKGLLCAGGVCREVPASNGFNLSISTSF